MANKDSYTAEQIQVLEGLEPVRKRPGMYIGSTDTRGLHECLREIIDNSVDESFAGTASEIWVSLNTDGSATVRDNGRGIPVDKHSSGVSALELTMTKLHAGGKFGGGAYKISGGLHGVGASVVNALSKYFRVIVFRNGKAYFQEYIQGKPKGDVKIASEKDLEKWIPKEWNLEPGPSTTGIVTNFIPDEEIFGKIVLEKAKVKNLMRDRAYLVTGLTFHFVDTRDGDEMTYYFEGGIKSLVAHTNRGKKTVCDVVYVKRDQADFSCEVALQYTDNYTENVKGYVNGIYTTDGGTHVTGFRTALTRAITEYGKKTGAIKEDKNELTGEDLKEGLTAVVYVKMPSDTLQFESQTKAKLNNPEIQGFVASAVKEGLDTYLEEHPGDGKRILEKVLLAVRARLAARAAKDAVLRKGALDGLGLPGKLTDCQLTNPEDCELFIVEGDSAGGTVKAGRDRKFQAILPLFGKVLNTERARIDEIVKSDKFKDLIISVGTGISDQFDLAKLKYHRIIIMTDADIDGSHIRCLYITFFYRHLPEIVKNNHLYIAVSPLYRIKWGKEQKYFYSDEEKDAFVKTMSEKKFVIQRYKGLGEMNAQELWDTTLNPETRILKQINIGDAQKADEMFTMLMGDEVPPRKRFIQANAKFANLDI